MTGPYRHTFCRPVWVHNRHCTDRWSCPQCWNTARYDTSPSASNTHPHLIKTQTPKRINKPDSSLTSSLTFTQIYRCTHLCSRRCVSSESQDSTDSCGSPPCSYRSRCHRVVSHTHPRLKTESSTTVLSQMVVTSFTWAGEKQEQNGTNKAYQYTLTCPELFCSHWGRGNDSSPVCRCTDQGCIHQGFPCTHYDLKVGKNNKKVFVKLCKT